MVPLSKCGLLKLQFVFQALKNVLITAPVLALPNFSMQLKVETDASDVGIGAVLLHEGHPLAFISRLLGSHTRGLSTYEKEYMAVLLAVEHWRSYLQHAEFVIRMDHRSLVNFTDQLLHTYRGIRKFSPSYWDCNFASSTNRVPRTKSQMPYRVGHLRSHFLMLFPRFSLFGWIMRLLLIRLVRELYSYCRNLPSMLRMA